MKQFFFILAAALMLASCSKENDAPAPSPVDQGLNVTQIHHVFESDPAEIDKFTYDAQGRLVTTEEKGKRMTVYTYSVPGKIQVKTTKISDNSVVSTREVTLDAQGRVTQILQYDPAGSLIFTYQFTYDAEGYLILKKGIGPGYTFEHQYTFVNGNPVTGKIIRDGVHQSNMYFAYDGNIPNKMPMAYIWMWPGRGVFGKTNKNLCTEYREVDVTNVLKWHARTQYELDPAGYVKKEIIDYVHEGTKSVTTLTLQ